MARTARPHVQAPMWGAIQVPARDRSFSRRVSCSRRWVASKTPRATVCSEKPLQQGYGVLAVLRARRTEGPRLRVPLSPAHRMRASAVREPGLPLYFLGQFGLIVQFAGMCPEAEDMRSLQSRLLYNPQTLRRYDPSDRGERSAPPATTPAARRSVATIWPLCRPPLIFCTFSRWRIAVARRFPSTAWPPHKARPHRSSG